MIDFHFESDFTLEEKTKYSDWISRIIESEDYVKGDISYVFVDDEELLKVNKEYLGHDWYTDIITFDYGSGNVLSGDIFISIDRVRDNAKKYKVDFANELLRVMAHGMLHLAGYNDKTEEESSIMRAKEEEKIKLFHVEH
nr:rRNA maturation RNase YbeY [Allomuricauda sp.]